MLLMISNGTTSEGATRPTDPPDETVSEGAETAADLPYSDKSDPDFA